MAKAIRFRSAPCRRTARFPPAPPNGKSGISRSKFRFGTSSLCIQCGKCVLVCPHAVIRAKVYDSGLLSGAPAEFKSAQPRWREFESLRYTLQVSPEDCTGCRLCVEVCPAKSKSEVKHKAINMADQPPLRHTESENWDFFVAIPDFDRDRLSHTQVKDVQLLEPLFEFSGACAGCGETPYIKLLTQLFGDRALIANATGCSSIYGGNLPTTPYTSNAVGARTLLVQFLIRRQCRVWPGHAPWPSTCKPTMRPNFCGACPPRWEINWPERSWPPTNPPKRESQRSAFESPN